MNTKKSSKKKSNQAHITELTLLVSLNGRVDPEPQYTPPKWNDAYRIEIICQRYVF